MELSNLPPRISHIEVDFDGETVKLSYDVRKINNDLLKLSRIDALAACIVSWDVTSGGAPLVPEEPTTDGWQGAFGAVSFDVLHELWEAVWADFLGLVSRRGKS